MKITQCSRETFLKAQAGDIASRNEIIERNMGMIATVAARACRNVECNRGVLIQERIQDGVAHMAWVINHFDPDRGVRFTTYASRCMMGHMAEMLCGEGLIASKRQCGRTERTKPFLDRARDIIPLSSPDARSVALRFYIHDFPDDSPGLSDMRSAIDEMPEGNIRAAMLLRVKGKSFAEIGKSIERSSTVAQKLVGFGINHLKKALRVAA